MKTLELIIAFLLLSIFQRLVQIGQHEAQHVSFLATALGETATAPCNYTFPYDGVTGCEYELEIGSRSSPASSLTFLLALLPSVLGLSSVIENVGTSAYLGAASLITDPAYVVSKAFFLSVRSTNTS